ncbi:hypothetical protein [Pseudoxanthomonas mexicana]
MRAKKLFIATALALAANAWAQQNTDPNVQTGPNVACPGATATGASSIAIGECADASGNNSVIIGKESAGSGNGNVNVGVNSTTSQDNATSVGNHNNVNGQASTGVGHNNNVQGAFNFSGGSANTTLGQSNVTLGDSNTTSGNRNVNIGSDSDVTGTESVNVGSRSDVSANQGTGVGSGSQISGVNGAGLGFGFTISGANGSAFGTFSSVIGQNGGAFGYQSTAWADETLALGARTWAGAENCVALGNGSSCMEENTVSVGSGGNERRISNVANGRNPTDAATMGQLMPITASLGGGAGFDQNGHYTPWQVGFQNGSTYYTVSDALLALDGRVTNLENAPPGTGTPGRDGYSAYEVAIQNGFVGTETEWLASLQGRDGDTGPRGPQGPEGPRGPNGEDGRDGQDGEDGDSGSGPDPVTTTNNSTTKVDARSIYVAPIVPVTAPSSVAVGNVMKETTACGPLQRVVATPILGTQQGLFRRKTVAQGVTYELAPFVGPDGQEMLYHEVPTGPGRWHMFGHQAVIFTTTVGTSSVRNLALGGGGSDGSWGQAGGGDSSGSQQLVTNIQLVTCDLGVRVIQ